MTDIILQEEFSKITVDAPTPKVEEPKIPEYKLYYDPQYAELNKVHGVNAPRIEGNIGLRGVSSDGASKPSSWSMDLTMSATDSDTVERTSGTIYYADGTNLAIDAGNTGNMSAVTYIYSNGTSTLQTSTTASDSIGTDKVLVCVAGPTSGGDAQFQAFGTLGNGVFITADNIAANTITANEIAANTITATQMNVSQLSAIAADMGTITAGTVTGGTIQTDTSGNGTVLARYGSAGSSTYKEIKMYVSSGIPTLGFTYNNSVVGNIKGSAYTIDGSTTNALSLVTPSTSDYVYTNGTMYMAGKMRIPVGTDLYN